MAEKRVTEVGVWLICGRTETQGCTCSPADPSALHASEAITRRTKPPDPKIGGHRAGSPTTA